MMHEYERDEEEDVVEGEILAEQHDQTILHLPAMPEDDAYYEDYADYEDYAEYGDYGDLEGYDEVEAEDDSDAAYDGVSDPGRRGFLSRMLLGGVAAAALGGSAALLYNEHVNSPVRVGATSLPGATQAGQARQPAFSAQDPGQLRQALAAVTADRDRLASELEQANADLVEMRRALDSAMTELDGQRSLNSLWQQLDDVGLDLAMAAALGTMGGNLANLARVAGLLREGLEVGRSVVDWFLNAMLRPQNGIRWLQRQVNALATSIDWLLEQVREVVQPAATLAATLTDFVISILDKLPGNFGSRADAGLHAMRTVLDQLPELIRGISDDVLDPLADWFGSDEARNLQGLLVAPIVTNVFRPASEILAKVDELETAYNQEVSQPTQNALAERETLREQIRQARSDLGLTS